MARVPLGNYSPLELGATGVSGATFALSAALHEWHCELVPQVWLLSSVLVVSLLPLLSCVPLVSRLSLLP